MKRRISYALAALAMAVGTWGAPVSASAADFAPAHDLLTKTPIKHFVVLMQENHSFDNYFGTYPGADGIPAGTCMPLSLPATATTSCVKPYHLDSLAISDMGHSADVFAKQYNNGQMNGFLDAYAAQSGVGTQSMGYFDDRDIPYYWNLADNYVLFDRLFTSAAGGSVWNHMYWVTGSPGNPDADRLRPSGFDDVPTIFDRLQAAGISWKFYVQNYRPDVTFRTPGRGEASAQLVWVPPLNYNRFLDDPALNSRIVDMSQYYKDLADGTLPAVSFMVPYGASEHPPGSIQAGERFVRTIISSLMTSTSWDSSAFMLTYDDWGGWYDHVSPPRVDPYGYGFRSPGLLVSPYARQGYVDSTTLDFTSELKFIENNWGVAPLTSRDGNANDITGAFDFTQAPREPVLLSRGRAPTAVPDSRTAVVYGAYGSAVLLLPPLVTLAVFRRRRPNRKAER